MSHVDHQSPRSKRRKIDHGNETENVVPITSHTQLRSLLAFQQNVAESKHGKYSGTPLFALIVDFGTHKKDRHQTIQGLSHIHRSDREGG